jgi:hypothetical protein
MHISGFQVVSRDPIVPSQGSRKFVNSQQIRAALDGLLDL